MPTTENGVEYTILRKSTGPILETGDQAGTFYAGWTVGPDTLNGSGTVFDGNYSFDLGYAPVKQVFTFTLGQNRVIEGWEEALLGQRVGTVLEMTIPSDLAYGSSGSGALIPPDTDLRFKVFIVGRVVEGATQAEFYDLKDYGIRTRPFGDYADRLDRFATEELIGYKGRDFIEGDEFAQAIIGLGGKDVLTGHGGGDPMIGGAGADRFVYHDFSDSTRQDPDVILDMQRRDRIDLRPLNDALEADGFDAFVFDRSTQRLTGEAGQLVYHRNQDILRGDVDGDGRADFLLEFVLKGTENVVENMLML